MDSVDLRLIDGVRPLAGAGIEINPFLELLNEERFAPSRGRELKFPG